MKLTQPEIAHFSMQEKDPVPVWGIMGSNCPQRRLKRSSESKGGNLWARQA
jgi:hypothetical protein